MEYDERADELLKEADKLEHESNRLAERTEQTKTEWEAKKSDPSGAPGAADAEATGPHNLEDEDPATGRNYGEERQAELEDAEEADAEASES